ncbi:Serine/threonine-protein kinase Nek3 [Babesia sp. Xinjiang]|uniref:Serine/threonine-protein kinase Nek3 n=1 Tax=Babesia sp. Xinjiang TaxID=462227 RepID=UPI000A2410C6|nr:Serine/threonine-protein kinase Nek3 [Babesia sp. Xinjiang]ORM39380.1 Serine/threonine-protein kinase Nek3 [Babesia sp. Xinjiang]
MFDTAALYVVRNIKDHADNNIKHIRSQSTEVPIVEHSDDYLDNCCLQDELSILLPEESIVDYHTNSLLKAFHMNGYKYCGEAVTAFSSSSYYTYHIIKSVATATEYFVKVLDLTKCDGEYVRSKAFQQVAIAEHLADHCCHDPHPSFTDGKDKNASPRLRIQGGRHHEAYGVHQMYSQPCLSDHVGKDNILHIQDSFITQDNYLVMIYEKCAGGDLWSLISEARQNGMQYFDEELISTIFLQVCLGLEYFHQHNVVHGDIKASNVMLKDEYIPIVKLADYDTCHMATDRLCYPGTLMYTAPEILLKPGTATTYQSDVWALGCLLYELLTLSHPFDNPCSEDSMVENFAAFDRHKEWLLANLPQCYSANIRALIEAIFQADPNNRPSVTKIIAMMGINRFGVAAKNDTNIS